MFQPEGYSLKIFKDRYAFTTEENWNEACQRVARQMAQAEVPEKNKIYIDKFYEILVENYFVPGGRIWYNSGRNNPQLLNCFVLDPNKDSKEGWGNSAKNVIVTSMTGGGCGDDFSDIRPRGASINSQKGECPGPVELMKLIDGCSKPVKAGGQRRVALIFSLDLEHPDVEEFLDAKLEKGQLTHANISVRSKKTKEFIRAFEKDLDWELSWKGKYKKIIKARNLWNKIVSNAYNSAEPGFLNWELVSNESNIYYIEDLVTTNPCITGDTLVYTADGRGNIPIKTLAEKGEDVSVFCMDNSGRIAVRMMRNPRLTGSKKPVFKITLDDGSTIKATDNHKFLLKTGEYKEVKNLVAGDSLNILTKYEASLQEIFKNSNSRSQDYIWLNNGYAKSKAEHRYIAEFYNNIELKDGLVVHHIDYNAKNNSPNNLRVMTKKDHDTLHSKDMIGDKNPMRRAKIEWSEKKWASYKAKQSENSSGQNNGRYLGVTNEELKNHAKILCVKLGRRFSVKEWHEYAEKNNLPKIFSKWRKSHLGGIATLAKWATIETEMSTKYINQDTRLQSSFLKYSNMGYNCEIINNKIVFIKNCEHCEKEFTTELREVAFCGSACANRSRDKKIYELASATSKNTWENKHKNLRIEQIKIFKELKENLGRDPFKKEWQKKCKEKGISIEISRKSSPFISWKELKDKAFDYNHKIVSIEFVGYEDVYNGTVDEFHNFYIGGFESTTASGKKKWSYINNLQCGEIALSAYDCCCLGHLVLPRFFKNNDIDYALLGNTIRTAVRFLDNVLTVNHYPLPEMKEKSHKLRRIGLGTTGLADLLALLGIKYGSEEGNKFIDKLYRFISKASYEASIMLAVEKGAFPACNSAKHIESDFIKRMPEKIKSLITEHGIRNCAILTQAPTGTVSILSDNCSSGIEPMFSPAYERRYWDKEERKVELVFHPLFAKFMKEGKNVDHFVGAKDLTVKEHMEVQKHIQKHVDNAVSKTINLPENYPIEDMEKLWLEYLPYLKGTTFYRENTRGYVDDKGVVHEPPLKSIDLEEAKKRFSENYEESSEIDCNSGSCEI